MIKLTELLDEEISSFDEREYRSTLFNLEKPYLNDIEALRQLVNIYKMHLQEMTVFLNNAERGIKN